MTIEVVEDAVRCSECESLNPVARDRCIWCENKLEDKYEWEI